MEAWFGVVWDFEPWFWWVSGKPHQEPADMRNPELRMEVLSHRFVLSSRRSNHMKQFWMLRRYLKQNGVNKAGPKRASQA